MKPHSDRVAESMKLAIRNSCMESDFERLPAPIQEAIELLLLATISHPFFATARVASLLTLTAERYRQSLHEDDVPRLRVNHR